MAVVRCGLPDLIVRLATAIHDLNLTESANGRIARNTAARELNAAARRIQRRLIGDKVDPELLGAEEFTLTQDAGNTSRYLLPPRCVQVLWVKDGGGSYYDSLDAANISHSGVVASGRYVDFFNVTPTASITAKCVLEPAEMSYGQLAATSGATSLVLASAPTIGNNILVPNSYVSAVIGLETGSASGYTAQVTAFTLSTRACTVSTMSPAAAANDYYSVLMGLPECMADAVIGLAAYETCKWDEALTTKLGPKGMQMLKADAEEAYVTGRRSLNAMMYGHIQVPRRNIHDPFRLTAE